MGKYEVQIIGGKAFAQVRDKINIWLEENPDITPISISTIYLGSIDEGFLYTTILYKK